jgi:hypothetical protein
MTTENVLPEGKLAAVFALARGRSTTEAAGAAKVTDRTIRRWLDDPDFRAEVHKLRSNLLGQTVGALVDAAIEAVATLRASLTADSEPVRVRAAVAILSSVVTIRETADLEERIAALEAEAEQRDGSQT